MIDILPTAEQDQLVGSVASAIAKLSKTQSDEFDRAPWTLFAELGCIGMTLAPEAGGSGFTIADEMLVNREFGRQLVSPNVLAASLAARLAMSAGDTALARAIAEGRQAVTFASPITLRLIDGRLTGEAHLLSGAEKALALLISREGSALISTEAAYKSHPVASTDERIDLLRAEFRDAPALCTSPPGGAQLWLAASLLLAAQMAGIAEATQEQAVAYAKLRQQFGKPIGAFQAVAHHCANMAQRTESALAQIAFAAVALRDEWPDAQLQVASACAVAMDAAFQNATVSIQIHGGMGYSAESGLHRYLKRAILLRHLAGGEKTQLDLVYRAHRVA